MSNNCLGLITAVKKAFENGIYGKSYKWECGLGGYDTGYQCSFRHTPYFEIKADDSIVFLCPSLMKRRTGLTPSDIVEYLNEVFNFHIAEEE